MLRDKSYSGAGASFTPPAQAQGASGWVSCCWQRDKRLQLWDILTPLEPDRGEVILSNKLENVKKIQMVCFKTDFF